MMYRPPYASGLGADAIHDIGPTDGPVLAPILGGSVSTVGRRVSTNGLEPRRQVFHPPSTSPAGAPDPPWPR